MNISMLRERGAQFEEGTFDGLDPSQMDMATLEIQIDLACIDLVSHDWPSTPSMQTEKSVGMRWKEHPNALSGGKNERAL